MNPISMADPWVTDEDIEIVLDALRNGWCGDRKYWYVENLEADFARFHDRKFALMTPNCTSAIHLLLAGLGIGDGDEVVLPECTWIASAAPVSYVRANPVFCDIDPVHWCMDPASLEAAINGRTKAIICVDLFGNMPNMAAIEEICRRREIALIEDAAEALGSIYNGTRAGKFGVASVFSFHRTKTLTTGEGGMLLLDDDDLFARCKFLRDHGRVEDQPYFNSEVAFKYMPSNLQASLGYAQFQRLSELVERKRWIFQSYAERLADVPDLQLNPEPDHVYNSYWATTVVFGKSHGLTKRDAVARLEDIGLPSRPFFYPLSSLPAYPGREPEGRRRNPVSYDVSDRGIILPGAFAISEAQIQQVCDGVRHILG